MLYGWEKGYEKYVVKDKIWLFGMDPQGWPGFLHQYGWRVVEDLGAAELARTYVTPTGRKLPSTMVERMIHAEKV